MDVTWFVARRDDAGKVVELKTRFTEAVAVQTAEALNRMELHPLIDLTRPESRNVVTCPRWTAHWWLA